MKRCLYCGRPNEDDAMICAVCGKTNFRHLEESAAGASPIKGIPVRADNPSDERTEMPPPEKPHFPADIHTPPASIILPSNVASQPIPPSHQLPPAHSFDFDLLMPAFFAWLGQRWKHHRMGVVAILSLLVGLIGLAAWAADKLPRITHQKPVVYKLWAEPEEKVPEGDNRVKLLYQLSIPENDIRTFRWDNNKGEISPGRPPFYLSTKNIDPHGTSEKINIALIVEDNDGYWSDVSKTLTVEVVPADQYYRKPKVKDIAYDPGTFKKPGDPVTLKEDAADPQKRPLTYEWICEKPGIIIEGNGQSATLHTDKMNFINNEAAVPVKVIVSDGIEGNEKEQRNTVYINLQPRVYKRVHRKAKGNRVPVGPQTATVSVGPPKSADSENGAKPSPAPPATPVTKPSP